jgi:hypothetical protein
MPHLKTTPDNAYAVGMRAIGQYWPPPSDWDVRFGPKMRTSSERALRYGLQITSRSFWKHRSNQTSLSKSSSPYLLPVFPVKLKRG